MRKVLCVLLVCLTALSAAGCGGRKPVSLDFKSELDEVSRVYYIGDEFESYVDTADGKVSRVPKIFVNYSDGTQSDDVSSSENISFSGYDLNIAGTQYVIVEYKENSETVKAKYEIEVLEQEIVFIEAEDPVHLNLKPFKVGEKFCTYYNDNEGDEYGVTLRLHMKDPSRPYLSYFTNAEEVESAEFDTELCKLDENGCFTEAGIFTVSVTYEGFFAQYEIKVAE